MRVARSPFLAVLLVACGENQAVVGGPRFDAAAPDQPAVDLGVTRPDVSDVPAPQDILFRCGAPGDCVGRAEGPACDVTTGRCVPCTAADDRCGDGRYCDARANTCLPGCRDDDACARGADGGVVSAGRCEPAARRCVACLTDGHCPPGQLCVGNLCVPGCSAAQTCPAGQTCCNGGCVDPQASTAHCGACARACAVANAAPACVNGTCAVGSCSGTFGDCDGDPSNGCEVDTRASASHCGACGAACAARPNTAATCEGGACRYACAAGFADCDGDPSNGCEVDTRASLAHCGACGRACTPANGAAACVMGACGVSACNTGFADCDGDPGNGCEADTRSSVAHCGACDRQCPSRPNGVPACAGGTCAITCVAGFAECDGDPSNGCEVATTRDPAHCGGCGRRCALANATSTCAAGACVVASCSSAFGDCDGDPSNGCEVDTRLTRSHCGACGRRCAAGEACSAGACVGADGPLTVAAGQTRDLGALASAGRVTAIRGATLTVEPATGFRAGDEALLINLQGSRSDTNAVGRREFVEVLAARDGAVDLATAPAQRYGNGDANADLAGQSVFLVRVPHVTTAVIDGTLTARAWEGTAAGLGLVALRASASLTIGPSGAVDLSARGYRSQGHSCNGVTGLPGESLAPMPSITADCYYEPPSRDPNRGGGGGGLSDCNRYSCTSQLIGAGGGGAGYGTAGSDGLPNGSLHRGGLGGITYGTSLVQQWFLGSGGGAGAGGFSGPGTGTRGGLGGGVVFLDAPTMTVRGRVSANGQAGGDNSNCTLGRGSGSSGGGAGGTIYLSARTLSLTGATVSATGAPGGCLGGGQGGVGRVRVDCDTLDGVSCAGLTAAPTTPVAHVGRP